MKYKVNSDTWARFTPFKGIIKAESESSFQCLTDFETFIEKYVKAFFPIP